MKQEIKEKLLHIAKRCYNEGLLTGISGNVSVFDRESGVMAITPTSLPYDEMLVDDIVCITLDGQSVSGKHKPSSEWPMHAVIYKENPGISAIIHTHSAYATSFAINNMSIPVILIEMVPVLGGDIKLAEFAMPGTQELGLKAVEALKDKYACLLANHGVLAIGESLDKAYIRATCLEDIAKTYSFSLNNGAVSIIPDEVVQIMKRRDGQGL